MLRAVHLRHELGVHRLVERFPAGPTRHFRSECFGVGKYLARVVVAADDHLRPLSWRDGVERRPLRPFGHVAMRMGLELGAARIEFDHIVGVDRGGGRIVNGKDARHGLSSLGFPGTGFVFGPALWRTF